MSKDDPINIAKHIQKGFDLAYPADAYTGPDTVEDLRSAQISPEEKQAWVKPKHPTKPGVHLIDSYPLLPDWDALPDGGAYMIFKFKGAPLKDTDAYDERLDVGLLRPLGPSVEDHERYQSELAAYEEDPTRPVPLPRSHFEFYLPADTSKEKVRGIKRNFATYDPENADEIPFETGVDVEGRPRKQFKFEMVRTYETDALTGNPNGPFEDVVAIALHDDNDPNKMRSTKLQKAAYFYPISHRTVIKPRRGEKEMVEEQPRVDAIETVTRDPTEEEAARREATRKQYEGTGTEGGES
jgi:RNA polymerase II-associated factor 1